MIVNHKGLSRAALVLCSATLVAVLGLGSGCSTDDIEGDATAQGVESALNSILTGTVEPLVEFLGVVTDLAGGVPARSTFGGGVTCPNTAALCAGGGTAVCAVTGGGFTLTFDFDQCVVVSGDLPLTLDGGLVVTPGATIVLQLNGLFINGSPAMTGPASVNVGLCSYTIGVSTTDPAFIDGTIFQCDADAYPTAASNLTLTLDAAVITISFNGSATASAAATSDGSLIANCTINLDSLASSCSAP